MSRARASARTAIAPSPPRRLERVPLRPCPFPCSAIYSTPQRRDLARCPTPRRAAGWDRCARQEKKNSEALAGRARSRLTAHASQLAARGPRFAARDVRKPANAICAAAAGPSSAASEHRPRLNARTRRYVQTRASAHAHNSAKGADDRPAPTRLRPAPVPAPAAAVPLGPPPPTPPHATHARRRGGRASAEIRRG